MIDQPEALRLADALEMTSNHGIRRGAAAELRRLYAELERCKAVCAATAEGWRSDAALAEQQEPVAMDWLHKWANQDDGEPETQWHEGYEAARRVVQIHLTATPQRPAEPVQDIKGCDHCEQPLYAAIKCRVCGRVTPGGSDA